MKFIKDEKARIPFSVIGVFLLIGSSITNTYIASLEKDKSIEIANTLYSSEVKQVLRYVESDISRALSYSVLYALKIIGEKPIIHSDLENSVSRDYADCNDDQIVDLNLKKNNFDDIFDFNINYAKNITCFKLNKYLKENFLDGRCRYQDYIINVETTENTNFTLSNWRGINFEKVTMKLERNCFGIDDLFVTEDSKRYVTYFVSDVKINITLYNPNTNESYKFLINPTCIIPSRLPIMIGLTDTFIRSINGREGDIFGNKLCIFVTLLSELYTEARALIQWSQGTTKIKNIVDNEWLKFLVNSGLILEEFMVYNSVDPMSLIELARNVSDLKASNKEALNDKSGLNLLLDFNSIEDKMFEKIENDLNYNIDSSDNSYNQTEIKMMVNEAESNFSNNNMIDTVQYIAEDILYDVECSYYYHRRNLENNPVDENYKICNLKDAYVKLFPDYIYETKGFSFLDPKNSNYKYILGKPNAVNEDDVVIRKINKDKISQAVKNIIEEKLRKTYTCKVKINVLRSNYNDLGYNNGWKPDFKHGDKLINKGKWNFVSSEPIGNTLISTDIIPSNPYSEEWKVTFYRTDEYEICNEWDYKNNKCNQTKKENHDFYQEHIVEFGINLKYNSNDIDSIFIRKNNIFQGETPHQKSRNDDNLEEIRHVFPSYFIENIRDNVIKDYNKKVVSDKNYFYSDGINYHIEWILAKDDSFDNGCVVEALEEIIKMIIEDKIYYSNASKEYNIDSNSFNTMEKGRRLLLNTFNNFKNDYDKEFFYHIDKDLSKDFISVGSKTVYLLRKWFTDEIQTRLEESKKDEFEDLVINEIGSDNAKRFETYEEIQNNIDYKNSLTNLGNIGAGQGIQCGLVMNLDRGKKGYRNWKEDIAFAIDREPNYFNFNKPENAKWDFNIKNICLGGPTGIPLLPIPPIPWFCTINLWSIEIDGIYEKFKLVDTLDETHPSQLFGHDGQIYMRNKTKVYDIMNGQLLGENRPIDFSFWTMNLAIVPPNKLPIGDQTGGIIEEN